MDGFLFLFCISFQNYCAYFREDLEEQVVVVMALAQVTSATLSMVIPVPHLPSSLVQQILSSHSSTWVVVWASSRLAVAFSLRERKWM